MVLGFGFWTPYFLDGTEMLEITNPLKLNQIKFTLKISSNVFFFLFFSKFLLFVGTLIGFPKKK